MTFDVSKQLTSLLLRKGENSITTLKADALRSVPKIESINLERNAIKSIDPQAFAGAQQLMLLNLYGNHITTLPPRGFKVKNLQRNYMYSNHIAIIWALQNCCSIHVSRTF